MQGSRTWRRRRNKRNEAVYGFKVTRIRGRTNPSRIYMSEMRDPERERAPQKGEHFVSIREDVADEIGTMTAYFTPTSTKFVEPEGDGDVDLSRADRAPYLDHKKKTSGNYPTRRVYVR